MGATGAWDLKGAPCFVINATAFDLVVYPANGAGDTINGQSSTSGVTIPPGLVGEFIGATGYPQSKIVNWYMNLSAGGGGTGNGFAIVAAAGSTQGTATAIGTTAQTVSVTATLSSEGVKLPTAVTGKSLTLLPPTTKGVKVYGGAAGQLINAATTATTAFAMASAQPATFYAVDATHWRVNAPGSFTVSALTDSGAANVSGLATLSGGQVYNGQEKVTLAVVKATGNSFATGRTVGTTTSYIVVNATASTEGVILPAVISTGLRYTILAPSANGVKVYAGAAGQSINAGTTNTTAFLVTLATGTVFYGVSTTKWRTLEA